MKDYPIDPKCPLCGGFMRLEPDKFYRCMNPECSALGEVS